MQLSPVIDGILKIIVVIHCFCNMVVAPEWRLRHELKSLTTVLADLKFFPLGPPNRSRSAAVGGAATTDYRPPNPPTAGCSGLLGRILN